MFFIIGVCISPVFAQLRMKRICFLNSGQYTESGGIPICCDSDHDGLNEIIFETAIPTRWEIWEHSAFNLNHYSLVFADTGAYPGPPGITTGNFRPYDVGDIDGDSLTDLVGPNNERANDSTYNVVTTQESPNYSYYPENLSWWYRFSPLTAVSWPFYFAPDLDSDNRNEIVFGTSPQRLGIAVFENIANNQNVLVWNQINYSWSFGFGDFDSDGNKEFVTAEGSTLGRVYIYENIGDNQYQQIYIDTVYLPNGIDVFSGNDLDGDGRPEFFVAFYSYPSATNYLYMWEATGNNTYERTLIDQVTIGGPESYYRSRCGDIDGDNTEEIVWSIGKRVFMYKSIANNQFQRVWTWINGHGAQHPCAIVNVYDLNKNGYNEIVIGGDGVTEIWEVEAVRLLRPNGGEVFQGDSSELIQWQKFYPPRCDSLSLFYSTDNGRTYQLIAHSLQQIDTFYLWTVPNVNSDSCKIKIIAYGPGWQYDESDGTFSITSTGINEIATLPLAMTLGVEVYPNPAKSMSVVRYSLPVEGKVSLQLYNISGRIVKTLVDEYKKPGNYNLTLNTKNLSAGVYFLSLKTQEKRIIERLIIVK